MNRTKKEMNSIITFEIQFQYFHLSFPISLSSLILIFSFFPQKFTILYLSNSYSFHSSISSISKDILKLALWSLIKSHIFISLTFHKHPILLLPIYSFFNHPNLASNPFFIWNQTSSQHPLPSHQHRIISIIEVNGIEKKSEKWRIREIEDYMNPRGNSMKDRVGCVESNEPFLGFWVFGFWVS